MKQFKKLLENHYFVVVTGITMTVLVLTLAGIIPSNIGILAATFVQTMSLGMQLQLILMWKSNSIKGLDTSTEED